MFWSSSEDDSTAQSKTCNEPPWEAPSFSQKLLGFKRPSPSSQTPKDPEDDAAFEEFKAAFSAAHASDQQPHHETTSATPKRIANEKLAEEDEIYPSTLSCTQCFDMAFYCSSIGGQMTSIYRFGSLRSCTDLWVQWRFCMRTRAMPEDERRRKIKEWNMAKAVKSKTGPSSEDVWEVRTEVPENPFAGNKELEGSV